MTGTRGPLSTAGVTAPSGTPTIPTDLCKDGKAAWKRITTQMESLGTLASTDGEAIAQCCRAIAWQIECKREVKRDGSTFKANSGDIKTNPAANIVLRLEGQITGYLDRFGLNPTARARVKPSQQLVDDPFDEFNKPVRHMIGRKRKRT